MRFKIVIYIGMLYIKWKPGHQYSKWRSTDWTKNELCWPQRPQTHIFFLNGQMTDLSLTSIPKMFIFQYQMKAHGNSIPYKAWKLTMEVNWLTSAWSWPQLTSNLYFQHYYSFRQFVCQAKACDNSISKKVYSNWPKLTK